MNTRREFLQATAGAVGGLVFVGCDLMAARPAWAQARRREIVVNGKRVNPEGVRHLAAEVGAGQLLVGTDFPYPWTKTAVDLILEAPGLSDADKTAILGGTAGRLLGIKS